MRPLVVIALLQDMAITVVFTGFLGCAAVHAQDVDFCSFPLPKGALEAHMSFSLVYTFDVNRNGVPRNIQPLAGQLAEQFIRPATVQKCIENWHFPQSASKHLTAVFEWQHGSGWTKLSVTGPGTQLSIHLSGVRCPYCAEPQVESPKN